MTDATLDLATVWDQIRERLATSLSPQQNAMLNLTRPLGLVEDTAVLAAPNEFTQTVLESRMRRALSEALSEQFGRDIRVAVQLEDAPVEQPAAAEETPIRRAWTPPETARTEDDEDRARVDDGRSAFGVGADGDTQFRLQVRNLAFQHNRIRHANADAPLEAGHTGQVARRAEKRRRATRCGRLRRRLRAERDRAGPQQPGRNLDT